MCPFSIRSLHTNIYVIISDHKVVSGWKPRKHMASLLSLLRLETFTICRMILTQSIHFEHMNDHSKHQYLQLSPPQHYIQNKRAYVGTSTLSSYASPAPLCYHDRMTPADKSIWDRAYLNEYVGLT